MWTQTVVTEKDFFNTLYELYVIAVVIGLRAKRKAKIDRDSDDKRTIQSSQLSSAREKLRELMKLVLLLDDSDNLSNDDKVNRAFRGPKSDEEFAHNNDLFHSYALGGIELLYEELVLRELDLDDEYTEKRVGNIIALLKNDFILEI